jgi:hypothetical protein
MIGRRRVWSMLRFMEVVCSRCRSVLASGAGLGDEAVLNGSVMGLPRLPVGVFVVDPAAVRSRSGVGPQVEQAPAHSVVVRPDSVGGRHVRRKRRPIRRSDVRRARIRVPGSSPVTFRDVQPGPVHEICS